MVGEENNNGYVQAPNNAPNGGQVPPQQPQNNGETGTAALVLGLLSFFIGGLILGIIGIVISANTKKKVEKGSDADSKATVGLVFSIIGTVKGVIVTFVVIISLIFAGFAATSSSGLINRAINAREEYSNKIQNFSYYDNDEDDELTNEFAEIGTQFEGLLKNVIINAVSD